VEELMPISDLELADLKTRTATAIRTNSLVANVEEHIEKLVNVLGKSGLPKDKVKRTPKEYLYQLAIQIESLGVESLQVKQPEPTPKPKVFEAPPVQTPVVELKATPVEETPVVEPKDAGGKQPSKKKDKKS
jgi:hypothetical protein